MKNKISNKTRIYKILSYIGPLWAIGLVISDKSEEDLKFHVGQGIILNIWEIFLIILIAIVNDAFSNILYKDIKTNFIYLLVLGILSLIFIFSTTYYSIYGIVSVVKNKKRKLPLIGRFTFYK